jgi:hypothetical protein
MHGSIERLDVNFSEQTLLTGFSKCARGKRTVCYEAFVFVLRSLLSNLDYDLLGKLNHVKLIEVEGDIAIDAQASGFMSLHEGRLSGLSSSS